MAFLKKSPRLNASIGWCRNKSGNFIIGPMGTREAIAVLHGSRDDAEANAARLVHCWNACQGMKPETVKEAMIFLHALPNLLKDNSQLDMIRERTQELIAQAKEE